MPQPIRLLPPVVHGLAIFAAALLFLPSALCGAENAELPVWRVGLARVDITPGEPIWMHGYIDRKRPSEGVLDRIFAKALALESQDGTRALLITADLNVLRAPFAEAVVRSIMEATGLQRRQVLINVSHTHSGPVFGLVEPTRFDLSEEQQQRVAVYTERLRQSLADLSARALADLQPARLSFGRGQVNFVVNRRTVTPQGVKMQANPQGHIDPAVPVLRVDDAKGQLRAVVFGCACHNTTLDGSNYLISGDYAGLAQHEIERTHPGVQAMFLIGCGGDANPHPRGALDFVMQHSHTLAQEVLRVLRGELQTLRGPLQATYGKASLPLAAAPSRAALEAESKGSWWEAHRAKKMLAVLDRGEALPTEFEAPVAIWRIGALTLVALSGEVVSDYVPRIGGAVQTRPLWIAGYSNEVFGYLPSADDLREGGYETKGLIHVAGSFDPRAESTLVEHVQQRVQQLQPPQAVAK